MTPHEKIAAIAAATAGTYRFQRSDFATTQDFLNSMRHLEGMSRTRRYEFTAKNDELLDVPFSEFVIVVKRQPFDGPYVAETFNKRTRVRG